MAKDLKGKKVEFDIRSKIQAKQKVRAGLDIGANSVKVVEIAEPGGKAELAGISQKTIAEPSKRAAIDAIQAAVAEAKIASKDFAISVSGSFVIVRFLTLPRMSEEELKSAVRFEAEKFIPFNINDCVIDFQILAKRERENKIDILLVTAKKDHVTEKIKMVEDSGFSVRVVDVDTFALANAFLKNFPAADAEKTFALLDIGSKITNLSIIKAGSVRLVRDVAVGGNDFNVAISKSFGVDMDAAEKLKVSPPAEKANEVANCVKGVFNNLIDEMRLPLSYYENQFGRSVDEIYLSGGAVDFAGLEDMFRDALELKPLFWNPFQFLAVPSGKDADFLERMKSHFAVAVGLALR